MSDISSLSELSDHDEEIQHVRIHRIYPDRRNLFELFDDVNFKIRFRFTKATVMDILEVIGPELEPATHRNKSICARDQLLLTLRFYATSSFQQLIGDSTNVHKSTVCRIIKKVTRQISAILKPQYIRFPDHREVNKVKLDFFEIRGFPGVIGCIDCTHVRIQNPGGPDAERFRNRKGFFSINVQAVCNAQLKIVNIVARWHGSVHDSTIFNDCALKVQLENGDFAPGYLLGDSGYPCRSYLLTPLLNPQTVSQRAYNVAHIATRNSIERCFGVLKKRFPCLAMGMRLNIPTVLSVIIACATLHNLAIELADEVPEVDHGIIVPPEALAPEEVANIGIVENAAVRTAVINTVFNR